MRPMIVVLLLLSSGFLGAQNAALPKYRVLKCDVRHDNIAPINQAADQGYRLLFTYRLAVMRLDTAPPDTYRYLPVPESRGRNSLLNALNQQGALGYRWVAEKGVLEKEPHPHNYEYQGAEGLTRRSRDRSYESLLQDGFQPVNELMPYQIVMREVGEERSGGHGKPFRVLEAMRGRKLMEHVAELAKKGYRYRSPEYSEKGGGHALAMELCGAECGGPFEYRSFDVDSAAQLERDLNQLGGEGFRVVGKSLGRSPEIAERSANRAQRFVYRVIEAAEAGAVEQALNDGDRDGFVPLAATAHVGWTVHVFVIMEKATSETPN